MKRYMSRLLPFALGLGVIATQAHAAIDLTDVTDGITAAEVAIIAAVAIPVTAGLGLMAIKFGGKFLVKLMKSFSS